MYVHANSMAGIFVIVQPLTAVFKIILTIRLGARIRLNIIFRDRELRIMNFTNCMLINMTGQRYSLIKDMEHKVRKN